MKMDKHILFLIIIVAIISAGIVGATVMTNDATMKQEDFDGIKIEVPSDSEFVKTGDGVYKDSVNGIKINIFKNNESMIEFLKNTKKSKIIPIDDQPPQSVAFKKGDTINILVTNGKEGVAVSSKDGELTSKIANNVVFSDNHKSQKSSGLGFVKPKMDVKNDFNLIMLIVADVDTKIFNIDMLQENLIVVADDYNYEVTSGDNVEEVDDEDANYTTDISDDKDLDNLLTDNDEPKTTDVVDDDEDVAQTEIVDGGDSQDNSEPSDVPASADDNSASSAVPASAGDNSAPSTVSSSADDSSNSNANSMSLDECQKAVEKELELKYPDLKIDNHQEVPEGYAFFVVDNMNNNCGNMTIDPQSGQIFDFVM